MSKPRLRSTAASALLALMWLASGGALGRAERRSIDVDEARKLVFRALQGSTTIRLPGFGLEEIKSSYDTGFYVFEGQWRNPNPGSIVAGHYAVDKQTGDVWNAFTCAELASQHLKKLQVTIRERIGLSDPEYRRLRKPGPNCKVSTEIPA